MDPGAGWPFVPIQSVFLRVTETEANVTSISQKVQEQLDSEDTIILTDSKGSELPDAPGTQGIINFVYI